MAKAIESIYRDLEYARSIIKSSQEHESDGTDAALDDAHKDENSNRTLSDDWNMVDEGHLEKEVGGLLAPLKRVSLGLSGLTNTLHPSRPT